MTPCSSSARAALNALSLGIAAALFAACGSASDSKRLEAAKRFLQQRDANAAVIELKNVLQSNPRHPEARFLLGKTWLDGGDPVAAEAELRRALEARHPESEVVPVLARSLAVQRRFEAMLKEFGNTDLPDAAASANLSALRAQAHLALGAHGEAQRQIDAALVKVPRYRPALEHQARLHAARGDIGRALAVAEGLVGERGDDAEAWSLKGEVLMQAGGNSSALAVDAYRKALQIQPKLVSAHSWLIGHLLTERQIDAARAQWQALNTAQPGHPQARFFEALLALHRGDAPNARELSQALVRVSPFDPRVLMVAAQAELMSGSLLQAEALLNKAVSLAPEAPEPRRVLADAYLRAGQSRKAIDTLTPLLSGKSEDAQALTMAGQAHLMAGDLSAADALFARAGKLAPADPKLRTGMALAQIGAGKADAGLAALEAVARSGPSTEADLPLINARLQRRQYAEAMQAIDRYAAKVPEQPLSDFLRGRVALAQDDRVRARVHWDNALRKSAQYLPALTSLAELDIVEGRPGDARARLAAASKREPKNASLLVAQAHYEWRGGADKTDVANMLRQAARTSPSDPEPRLRLIDLALAVADHDLALGEAQQAVSALPNHPGVLERLGLAQQAKKDFQQAASTFGKLASLVPSSPMPLLQLAEVNVDLGRLDVAFQNAQRAMQVDPNSAAATRMATVLAMRSKRSDEAAAIARAAHKRSPAFGWRLEGDIAREQNDFAAAAAAFRKSLASSANDETARILYTTLLDGKREADAERFAGEWLQLRPKDTEFLLQVAYVAERRDDLDEAERRLRQILAADPLQATALNNLALLQIRRNKPEALELAERANKLAPNRPAFMDTLAQAMAAAKKGAQALDLQTKVVEMSPGYPEFRLTLAKLQVQASKTEAAAENVALLAKLGPGFSGHAEVKRLAEQLRK